MANSVKYGLQNEEILGKISISGSSVIDTKNEKGIYIFNESDKKDGIIYSKLTKPYYNENELKKAVDIEITELIPIVPPIQPETVLKPIYDEALSQIQIRDVQIESLNTTILGLESRIETLNSVTESLRIELDNQKLLVANAENQLAQNATRLQTNVTELQNAIQKATSEAIKRVSLAAINDAISKENATLKDTLYGKQAKIEEGAQVTEEFSIKILDIGDSGFKGLFYKARANQASEQWINGPTIEIKNFSPEGITVAFTEKVTDMIQNISPVFVEPKQAKTIKLLENLGWIRDQKPKGDGGFTLSDKVYNGSLEVSSGKTNLSVSLKLEKFRGQD
jgi:hypothetical protein